MRKTLLLLALIALSSYAQNVDTTSPYIYVEGEVVDTMKAIETLKQIKAEKKAQIRKENEQVEAKIALIKNLKDKQRTKVKTAEEIQLLKEIAEKYKSKIVHYAVINQRTNMPSMDKLWSGLEKGKVVRDYYDAYGDILDELPKELEDETKYDEYTLNSLETIVPSFMIPKKKVMVKKENPNYGFRWLDKYNKSKLKHKSVSYPVKDEYYTSDEYPQYKFRQHNYNDKRWSVYDKSDNLLAVAMPFDYINEKDDIKKACNIYDFEHNAYNISQESEVVRNYIAAKFAGSTAETEIFARQFSIRILNTKLDQARQYLASRQITQQEFNRISQAIGTEKSQYEREIVQWQKKMPPQDVVTKANNYIEQLAKDNEKAVPDRMTKTRIDGLSFILTGGNLRLQQTYFYNKEKKRVESNYKVLAK